MSRRLSAQAPRGYAADVFHTPVAHRTMANAIDFRRLFKLRLVVARHGEMDVAGWWNTQGLLGPRGAMVLKRGLPLTHHFAQARVVFKVAPKDQSLELLGAGKKVLVQ